MSEKGSAFLKGGVGLLAAFLIAGLVMILLGRTLEVSVGGFVLLFLVGGIIGLVSWALYDRSRREKPQE